METNKPLNTKWQQKWLGLDNCHAQIQEMADVIEKWCARFYNNRPDKCLLVISGVPGNGKTHSAEAIFQWMRTISPSAFHASKSWPRAPISSFMYWPSVVDAIRNKELGSVEEGIGVDGLILDDVGADDDPFKQAADKLCQILSRREFKFTVITTNIEQKDWAEKFEARIVDRFMRNSIVVNLDVVPSYALML